MNGRRSCAPTGWCLRSGISIPLRWKWLLIRLGMLQGKEEDMELLLADMCLTQSYICQSCSNTGALSPADESSFASLTPSILPHRQSWLETSFQHPSRSRKMINVD
jgi:hypothetical protein